MMDFFFFVIDTLLLGSIGYFFQQNCLPGVEKQLSFHFLNLWSQDQEKSVLTPDLLLKGLSSPPHCESNVCCLKNLKRIKKYILKKPSNALPFSSVHILFIFLCIEYFLFLNIGIYCYSLQVFLNFKQVLMISISLNIVQQGHF